MQAVIVAGGKGTRLQGLTQGAVPKPMVNFLGKPILEHQIDQLRNNGIADIILLVGHLGDTIESYFGDGSGFGVHISYYHEKQPLGTAGALACVLDRLEDEFFFLLGDCIFNIDLRRMRRFHEERKATATIFAHPNSHPADSDLVLADDDDRVLSLDCNKNQRDYWYQNLVCGGIYIIPKSCCEGMEAKPADFEKDILIPMIRKSGNVYAYRSSEYIKDIGTPERYHSAESDILQGLAEKKSYAKPQKAIFIDRDGTVTRYKGLIYREEDIELLPGVAPAIKAANGSEWMIVMVTNQPVVARGLCDIEKVKRIHAKMETLLGQEGAYLNDCLFCPHHPDKGYPEENPAYKVECNCRKPKTGMIDRCVKKYNIDPEQSWMVGDTTVDIQTGISAGMCTALVKTGMAGEDGKYNVKADFVGENLGEVIEHILQQP